MIKQKLYKTHKSIADDYTPTQSRNVNVGHKIELQKKVMCKMLQGITITPKKNLNIFKLIFLEMAYELTVILNKFTN